MSSIFTKSFIIPDINHIPLTGKLILNNKECHLLNQHLSETSSIQNEEQDYSFSATFFHQSPFIQTLRLTTENKAQYSEVLSHIVNTKHNKIDEKILENISSFIYGSNKLKKNDFKELGNIFYVADGKGMINIGKYDENNDAEYRHCFLMMLGIAYEQAFKQISTSLVNILKEPEKIEKLDNLKELDKLYMDVAIFDARYYFEYPIETSKQATVQVWKDIQTTFQLKEKHQEMIEQLARLHHILTNLYQKKEQQLQEEENKLNEHRNKRLTYFGLALSAFGIIEIIDILKNWFI